MEATRLLCSQNRDSKADVQVAINWGGGRHHAKHSQAGGFCFINDAVLAIKYLLRKKHRVLYFDIDIHHCDGVSQAFYDTDNVLTCSFHKLSPGFFPGSGNASEKGRGTGLGFNVNVTLSDHLQDNNMVTMFQYALTKFLDAFDPSVVMLVVGADGLKGDPLVGHSGWRLTTRGLTECVTIMTKKCHDLQKKLLILGGGGYDDVNCARAFTACTAAACSQLQPDVLRDLPEDIPSHEFSNRYSPRFSLHTEENIYSRELSSNQKDQLKSGKRTIDYAVAYINRSKELQYTPFDKLDNDF